MSTGENADELRESHRPARVQMDPASDTSVFVALPPVRQLPAVKKTIVFVEIPGDVLLDEEGPIVFSKLDEEVRFLSVRMKLSAELTSEIFIQAAKDGAIELALETIVPHPTSFSVVALACTSFSFSVGGDEIRRRLEAMCPGARGTDMGSAVKAAVRSFPANKCGIKSQDAGSNGDGGDAVVRVVLVTPYMKELYAKNVTFIESDGNIKVVKGGTMQCLYDEEIVRVAPDYMVECAQLLIAEATAASQPVDVVVFGCSSLKTCASGLIPSFEEKLGLPVVTSQQAMLWYSLQLADVDTTPLTEFGSLFANSK